MPEPESPGARKARRQFAELSQRFPLMASWSLDTYPTDDAGKAPLEFAKRWCHVDDLNDPNSAEWEDLGVNLYLFGGVGSGKTGLAWSILRHHIFEYRGERGDFVNIRDLLAAARNYYSNGGPDPLEGLDSIDTLVLDDLGAERPTDWTRETIATLVERRYLAELGTIVTSNYSPSELIRRLGDPIIGQRIVSRLVESCTVVKVEGRDRRLEKAA